MGTAEKKANEINNQLKSFDKSLEESNKNIEESKNKLTEIKQREIEILRKIQEKNSEKIDQADEKLKVIDEKKKVIDEKKKNLAEREETIKKKEAQIFVERTKCSGAFFKSIGQIAPEDKDDIESTCKDLFPNSDVCRKQIDSKVYFKLKSFTPYEKYLEKNKENITKVDFSFFVGGFPEDLKPLIDLLKTATSIKEVILPRNMPLESKKLINEVTKIRTDLSIS